MSIEPYLLAPNKKIYIASDFHLGAPTLADSLAREKLIVRWLGSIQDQASCVILAGDIFDFWFEYNFAVPKGATRLLGKLAELADSGIKIKIFTGNHDLWMADYLVKEIGLTIYHAPQSFEIGDMKLYIGHGDGLGPGENRFKFIKKIFTSPFNKFLFKWLHPDIGIALANKWSRKSRKQCEANPEPYLGEDEPLFQYAQSVEKTDHHDYYIFGHRHLALEMDITHKSKYINLGDWITHFTYAEVDQSKVTLKKYEE